MSITIKNVFRAAAPLWLAAVLSLSCGLKLDAQTRLDLKSQSRNSNYSPLPDVSFGGNTATLCARCQNDVAAARLLNSVTRYSTPVQMTISGGTSLATTVRFYIDSSLNLRVQYDASVITAATFSAGLLPDTLDTGFPDISIPLHSCTVSALTFTSCTDLRATGSWIPSSATGSCAITATGHGWDFNCPGQGLTGVTFTKEMQAAACGWSGIAYLKDISVVAPADPGSACMNGIGALTFPDAAAGVEMLFSTIVPYGIDGTADVFADVLSPAAGDAALTLAVACRASNTPGSNYQSYPLAYGNAETRILTLTSTQTHRYEWNGKLLPVCGAGEELHWKLIRDAVDGHAGPVHVLRAVVTQRVN